MINTTLHKIKLADGLEYQLDILKCQIYSYPNNLTEEEIIAILSNRINLVCFNSYGIPFKIMANKKLQTIHTSWLHFNKNDTPATCISTTGTFNDLLFTLTINKYKNTLEVTPIQYIISRYQ